MTAVILYAKEKQMDEDRNKEEQIAVDLVARGYTVLNDRRFGVKNFKPIPGMLGEVTFIGQIENDRKDFDAGAKFALNIFDDKGALLNTTSFNIIDFKIGVKSFKTQMRIDAKKMSKFSIQFEHGN